MNRNSDVTRLSYHVAALRIAFGVIWAIDASFKWRPAFLHSYLAQVKAAASGQPHWLLFLYHGAERVIAVDPVLMAVATAVIESLTALGLMFGFARRYGYLAGAGFSILVWIFAEGFGGPYTAGSTDVGTGIIYALVFFALFGLDRLAGPSALSLDHVIEQRWQPWVRISEAGSVRSVPPSAPAGRTQDTGL